MARLDSYYSNYCPAGATTTVVSGAGKIHAIFASTSSATPVIVTIYDNTAASGNVLFTFYVSQYQVAKIIFDSIRPLLFSTGCTVVTPANTTAFVQTES